jgi:hypothetical protein
MTFEPKLYTYYVSQLDNKGQRIDIGPNFKYLTETETQACIGRLAVYLAKLRYKADKITDSLKDEKATTGFTRTCLENRIFALTADIRSLEYKYDQILVPSFPICRPSTKFRRVSLPPGVSIFLPSFNLDENDEKKVIKRLTIERASREASAIPRVVEEIKWRPPETSNISIIDRFDDFIEEPVEEIVRQLRAEGDIERRSRATSTPNPRDANHPLPNYSIDIDLSSNEPGISETIADFVSESDCDSDESAFFFLFRHFFNEAEMANLTQNMIDTLQQAGQQNTDALVTGMRNLNAQRKLESIPLFSGDSNCTLVIDEWFKIAERVARLARWTDPQKIIYFQEKLTKSAAHFNDSLDAAQRDFYDDWKDLLLQGLHDNVIVSARA